MTLGLVDGVLVPASGLLGSLGPVKRLTRLEPSCKPAPPTITATSEMSTMRSTLTNVDGCCVSFGSRTLIGIEADLLGDAAGGFGFAGAVGFLVAPAAPAAPAAADAPPAAARDPPSAPATSSCS